MTGTADPCRLRRECGRRAPAVKIIQQKVCQKISEIEARVTQCQVVEVQDGRYVFAEYELLFITVAMDDLQWRSFDRPTAIAEPRAE